MAQDLPSHSDKEFQTNIPTSSMMTDLQRSDLVNMLCPTFTAAAALEATRDDSYHDYQRQVYKNIFPSFFLSGKLWQIDYQPTNWAADRTSHADSSDVSQPMTSTLSSEASSRKSSFTADGSASG